LLHLKPLLCFEELNVDEDVIEICLNLSFCGLDEVNRNRIQWRPLVSKTYSSEHSDIKKGEEGEEGEFLDLLSDKHLLEEVCSLDFQLVIQSLASNPSRPEFAWRTEGSHEKSRSE
jgi:hypothetical protein